MQRSDGFCRVNWRQNESGVLRGGKFFRGLFLTEVVGLTVITTTFCGSVQNEHDHILWMVSNQSTKSVGFVTENIMVFSERQDDFEKFIVIKKKKCDL